MTTLPQPEFIVLPVNTLSSYRDVQTISKLLAVLLSYEISSAASTIYLAGIFVSLLNAVCLYAVKTLQEFVNIGAWRIAHINLQPVTIPWHADFVKFVMERLLWIINYDLIVPRGLLLRNTPQEISSL